MHREEIQKHQWYLEVEVSISKNVEAGNAKSYYICSRDTNKRPIL